MSDMFTTTVLPVVTRYARAVLKDDERVSLAIVLAWYAWRQTTDEKRAQLPATVWARVGVRHVLAGRDLPGVQTSHRQDAIERPDTWHGADMGGVTDRRAGPESEAIDAERSARFWDSLTPRERTIARALLNGDKARDVARRVGISAGRLTQIRQQLRRRWLGE